MVIHERTAQSNATRRFNKPSRLVVIIITTNQRLCNLTLVAIPHMYWTTTTCILNNNNNTKTTTITAPHNSNKPNNLINNNIINYNNLAVIIILYRTKTDNNNTTNNNNNNSMNSNCTRWSKCKRLLTGYYKLMKVSFYLITI